MCACGKKEKKEMISDLWFGKVYWQTKNQAAGDGYYTPIPIFVRASCQCEAEAKILEIFKSRVADAGAVNVKVYTDVFDNPGPYRVYVSSLEST